MHTDTNDEFWIVNGLAVFSERSVNAVVLTLVGRIVIKFATLFLYTFKLIYSGPAAKYIDTRELPEKHYHNNIETHIHLYEIILMSC